MNNKILSATVSFFIAILSGLGVGSGGLFVIWLTMVEGVDTVSARSMNLLFFVFSASAALLFHLIRKRIRIPTVAMLAVSGVAGTIAGSLIGGIISQSILRKIFGAMLLSSGIYAFWGKSRKNKFHSQP